MLSSHYRRVKVKPVKYAEANGYPDPLESVKYKWDKSPDTPLIQAIAGQEDLFRNEDGERVDNKGEARIVFGCNFLFESYVVKYVDGPTEWEEVLIELENTTRFVEYYIPETLGKGLYTFNIEVTLPGDITVISEEYYFEITLEGPPPAFDPTSISKWRVWAPVEGDLGELNDIIDKYPNLSNRLNSPFVGVSGQWVFNPYGANGQPSLFANASNLNGYLSSKTGVSPDILNYTSDSKANVLLLYTLPTILSNTTYFTILETGSPSGTFNGYSLWRIYKNKLEVLGVPYSFYYSDYIMYTIPFDDPLPLGVPCLLHFQMNLDDDTLIIRVNGKIVAAASGISKWTETVTSVSTGQVSFRVGHFSSLGSHFSHFAVGVEKVNEVSSLELASATNYLLEFYKIPGAYESL